MTITAHWDEARSRRADVGPMGADWDMLGDAAGCDRVGLRRIRVWPGRQSTPVHAHFGEEEIFYVLRGSGWSWQERGVHAIVKGDVILYPHGRSAHTVVAGDEGLDVLAFGDNLRHEAVRFPRIDAAWIGGMILDFHPVHQFQLEAERAGGVEIPEQVDPRPRTIVNVADVEPMSVRRQRVDAEARLLGRALGARRTALNLRRSRRAASRPRRTATRRSRSCSWCSRATACCCSDATRRSTRCARGASSAAPPAPASLTASGRVTTG